MFLVYGEFCVSGVFVVFILSFVCGYTVFFLFAEFCVFAVFFVLSLSIVCVWCVFLVLI